MFLRKKKVLVAMSGGVDSSVAASVLKDQGYDVVGATLQVWDYSKNSADQDFGTCCSSLDVEDARAVCQILDIPFYVINCEKEFKETVIDSFVEDYLQGQTPIPCTNCNTFLKFHYLIDKMRELNCDYLATGHYAEIRHFKSGKYGIFTSEDQKKDQTYFLFTIKPEILPQLLFPVGSLNKQEVRKIAEKKSLPVFRKKDSTGICFVGKRSYKSFIEDYVKPEELPQRGKIKIFPSGEELGFHDGIHHFTLGQRKGLGVSYKHPLFVVKINKDTREVWLGEESYLYSENAEVSDLHFLDEVKDGEKLDVKIRFQHLATPAVIHKKDSGSYLLNFVKPQKSITPGQSAVFYRNRQLIGGGVITKGLSVENV